MTSSATRLKSKISLDKGYAYFKSILQTFLLHLFLLLYLPVAIDNLELLSPASVLQYGLSRHQAHPWNFENIVESVG